MKITLEIPDTTICAFFDFVREDYSGMLMRSYAIDTEFLYDGNTIVIEEKANRKDNIK